MTKEESNKTVHQRSAARELAFQILYQEDLNAGSLDQITSDYLYHQLQPVWDEGAISCFAEEEDSKEGEPAKLFLSDKERMELVEFAQKLIFGVFEQRKTIDLMIEQVATRWSVSRMAVTDRNILRLAVYEMKWLQTPKPVVIHEAILLGKKFSGPSASSFINGILDSNNLRVVPTMVQQTAVEGTVQPDRTTQERGA